MVDARCGCGGLALSLPGSSSLVVACHCIDCQRRTGAPFGVGAFYPAEVVTISGLQKSTFAPPQAVARSVAIFVPTAVQRCIGRPTICLR